MTLGDIATKARALTKTDTSTYTNANLLIDINIWYQKIVTMILESMDDFNFDDALQTLYYPIAERTLAARRDYAFSTASWTLLGKEGGSNQTGQTLLPLKIKRLDISYNGGTNWYRATPIDSGAFPQGLGNDTEIDTNFIREAPRYDIKGNAIWLYPMPLSSDVSAGAKMRVEFDRNVVPFTSSELTTGTIIPGFDANFHPMLSLGAAIENGSANNLPQVGLWSQQIADWELRLRQHYGRKSLDTKLEMKPLYDADYGR